MSELDWPPRGEVAVTGATGFLGGHIVRALTAAGLPVRAVVRDPAKAAGLAGVSVRQADLGEPAAMAAALAGATTLVSNASLGSWAGDEALYARVNVRGVDDLLRVAREVGVRRVVVISTVAVLRTRLWRAMAEDATPYDAERRRFNWSDLTTDWRYARSKTLAEAVAWRHAREGGLAMTVLRPGPIYGSGDPKLTARYLRAAARRVAWAPTVGVPQVHAGDVAAAVVAALGAEAAVGRAYNLAGPPTSPREVQVTLRRLRGRGPVVVPVPVPVWVRYDCAAAARDLGFVARPLAEGLAEALAAGRTEQR